MNHKYNNIPTINSKISSISTFSNSHYIERNSILVLYGLCGILLVPCVFEGNHLQLPSGIRLLYQRRD